MAALLQKLEQVGERNPERLAVPIFLVAFLGALLVHSLVLDGFANSADEFVYRWQAEALAGGRLTAETPEPRDAFAFFHLGDREGVRYSRFPPGWPLLLTPGVFLGWPGGVNPLLGALALAGIYLYGVRRVGYRASLAGTLLVLPSAFFLLNTGSYHSHPSSLFALVGVALALDRGREREGGPYLFFAGAALGLAVLIRPFSAMLLGGPLLFDALVRGDWRFRCKAAVRLSVGLLPFASVFAWVNWQITGSPFQLATTLLDPAEGLGFGIHGHTPFRALQTLALWLLEGLATTYFLSPLLLFPALRRPFTSRRLLGVLLIAPVIGYFFYWNPGGNRYGPRFYFEGLLAFTLLVGVGLERVLRSGRYRLLLWGAAMIGVPATLKTLSDVHEQVIDREDVYRVVDQADLRDALVILLSGSADMHVFDLTRNPPEYREAPVLFARGRGEKDREIFALFKERRFYYYRYRLDGGTLIPADLAHPLEPEPIPDL